MRLLFVTERNIRSLDRDRPAIRHRVARIDAEIEQRIFKLMRIAMYQPELVGQFCFDADLRPNRSLDEFLQHDGDQSIGVRRLGIKRLASGERQQPMGERGRALRRAVGDGDKAIDIADATLRNPRLDHFKTADDAGQKVVEVMRQPAGELADRLHLLRLKQSFARLFEFLLRLLTLGEVARDLGEADQFTQVVNRMNDDARPKARAVLANAPPFRLVMARSSGRLQSQFWYASLGVFRRIEPRKMLANDFVRGIALDAFGAGVPVRHLAGRIQHIDCVVGHALNQEAKAAFAIECRGLLFDKRRLRAPYGVVGAQMNGDQFSKQFKHADDLGVVHLRRPRIDGAKRTEESPVAQNDRR